MLTRTPARLCARREKRKAAKAAAKENGDAAPATAVKEEAEPQGPAGGVLPPDVEVRIV